MRSFNLAFFRFTSVVFWLGFLRLLWFLLLLPRYPLVFGLLVSSFRYLTAFLIFNVVLLLFHLFFQTLSFSLWRLRVFLFWGFAVLFTLSFLNWNKLFTLLFGRASIYELLHIHQAALLIIPSLSPLFHFRLNFLFGWHWALFFRAAFIFILLTYWWVKWRIVQLRFVLRNGQLYYDRVVLLVLMPRFLKF